MSFDKTTHCRTGCGKIIENLKPISRVGTDRILNNTIYIYPPCRLCLGEFLNDDVRLAALKTL